MIKIHAISIPGDEEKLAELVKQDVPEGTNCVQISVTLLQKLIEKQ